jgi:transposase InsO family protein
VGGTVSETIGGRPGTRQNRVGNKCCLGKFIIFDKTHLDRLLSEFSEYYNTVRSHMERDDLPPRRDVPQEVETLELDQIANKSHVSGLVKSVE